MTSPEAPGALPSALGAWAGPLARTLSSGRLSPAYLLEGADPVVLREAAGALAAAVLCPERRLGCACPSCARVRAGRHRDLHRLVRDKATVISVAALEPVLQRAHVRPLEGERQVFVVDPAEALEPEGVARYLKTLEEPPSGTVFLLLTTRPERLPDTVRSRCRRIALAPLDATEIVARLVAAGVAPERAAAAARAATGSLERARRLDEAEIPARLLDLWRCAAGAQPTAARTVEGVRTALEAVAAARGGADEEPDDSRPAGRRREALRAALQDLLHALGVEGREAAAGRPAFGGVVLPPQAGLDLLEAAGGLGGAVALNVAPAAVLLEVVRALCAAASAVAPSA